jgi:hypothetical protein
MMSCTSAKCDPRSDTTQSDCGSFFAYIYFVAFYMICSFLVSLVHDYERIFSHNLLPALVNRVLNQSKLALFILDWTALSVLKCSLDHQFIRGSYYG